MENLRFEVIKSGRRFLSIDTRMLCNFINGFIGENAFLIYDKKFTLKQEKEFQKSVAKDMDNKNSIFVVCWKGRTIIGNSSASKEKFKQSHNVIFGLVVRAGYRGKGIGEKLLKMAIKEAKTGLKPRYLWIDHIDGNAPARNLYEKLGFKEAARLKNYYKHSGRYRDKVIMKYSKR